MRDWRSRLAAKGPMGVVLLAISAGHCAMAGAGIIYVDDDRPDGGDGSTWATAYRSLQDALTTAAENPSMTEVRIAQGIYRPDDGTAQSLGDQAASFQLPSGKSIRGGFAGLGAPNPDAFDPHTYKTMLSGDLLGNDLPSFGNRDDNSLHVVRASGVDALTSLLGVTIIGGHALSERSGAETPGGGGLLLEASSPIITLCTFRENFASGGGGAIHCGPLSNPLISQCSFVKNQSALTGGAVFQQFSNATIMDCAFDANYAPDGGAVAASDNSEATLLSTSFVDNGASQGDGGAIAISSDAQLTMNECMLQYNVAFIAGGALAVDSADAVVSMCMFEGNAARTGGGMSIVFSTAAIADSSFVENIGNSGGAIDIVFTNPVIERCVFLRNHAVGGGAFDGDGGAISCDVSTGVLRNSYLLSNDALFDGGAVWSGFNSALSLVNCVLSGNASGFRGGGIYCGNSCTSTITNCTLNRNVTFLHGGNAYSNANSAPKYRNSILWDGFPDSVFDAESSMRLDFCDFEGRYMGKGGDNIQLPPVFIDDAGADQTYGTMDDNLRLKPTSPCIDAGSNGLIAFETDLDGNARVRNGTTDMGAYETAPPCPADCAAPVNGSVDIADAIAVLQQWGQVISTCDVNDDAAVDILDLLVVLEQWGACP